LKIIVKQYLYFFKQRKDTVKRRFIFWAAVLIWMVLIFILSSQPAEQSKELSKSTTLMVLQAVERLLPGISLDLASFHGSMRKVAHFFLYLILGGFVWKALKESGLRGRRAMLTAFLICFLYAVSDETHQAFVPGRSAQLGDLLIDSWGGLFGILLWRYVSLFRARNTTHL
jgi:VanZ family protein